MSNQIPTVQFQRNHARQGVVPTPSGVVPTRRRHRRGMVDLNLYDAQARAYNSSLLGQESAPEPGLLNSATRSEADAIAAQERMVRQLGRPEPIEAISEGEEVVVLPSKPEAGRKESKGALMESSSPNAVDANRPMLGNTIPDPVAVKAMKAELAAKEKETSQPAVPVQPAPAPAPIATKPEAPSATPGEFIPPPPKGKKSPSKAKFPSP